MAGNVLIVLIALITASAPGTRYIHAVARWMGWVHADRREWPVWRSPTSRTFESDVMRGGSAMPAWPLTLRSRRRRRRRRYPLSGAETTQVTLAQFSLYSKPKELGLPRDRFWSASSSPRWSMGDSVRSECYPGPSPNTRIKMSKWLWLDASGLESRLLCCHMLMCQQWRS